MAKLIPRLSDTFKLEIKNNAEIPISAHKTALDRRNRQKLRISDKSQNKLE